MSNKYLEKIASMDVGKSALIGAGLGGALGLLSPGSITDRLKGAAGNALVSGGLSGLAAAGVNKYHGLPSGIGEAAKDFKSALKTKLGKKVTNSSEKKYAFRHGY